MTKTIDEQQAVLKNRLGPAFFISLTLCVGLLMLAQRPLAQYFAAQGLNPSSPLVQFALLPLITCLPLIGLYALIIWLIHLRCPECLVAVRRPSYRALERLHACPGCGCDWKKSESEAATTAAASTSAQS